MQQAKKKPGAKGHPGKSSYNQNHNPAGAAPASQEQGPQVPIRHVGRRQWQGRGR